MGPDGVNLTCVDGALTDHCKATMDNPFSIMLFIIFNTQHGTKVLNVEVSHREEQLVLRLGADGPHTEQKLPFCR